MLERFATGASTFARSIDHLIFLIAVLVGFWLIVAEVALFWLMFRYRRRDGHASQYVTGEEKHLTRWVTIPHFLVMLCDMVIIVPAILVWVNVKQNLPPAEQTVRIFSQQWAWSFQQPGPDGILDTADDIRTVGELHVKANTTYHFELHVARRAAQLLRSDVPAEAGCRAGPDDHRLVQGHAPRYIRHSVHADVRHGPRADGWRASSSKRQSNMPPGSSACLASWPQPRPATAVPPATAGQFQVRRGKADDNTSHRRARSRRFARPRARPSSK